MTCHGPYLERFITSRGTLVIPTCDTETQISLGPVVFNVFPLVGGGALNPYGVSGRAVRENSAISYPCVLAGLSPEALQSSVDEALSFAGQQGKLYMLMPDDTHRWVDAVMLDTGGTMTANAVLHTNATMAWAILSPYWTSSAEESALTVPFYDAPAADLLTTVTQALVAGVATALPTITNIGKVPQASVEITVTAQGGAVTSVTIVNSTTNYTLVWTGTLAAGTSLVIDTGALSVLANGVENFAGLTPPANHTDWMQLDPGANTWAVTVVGANATITVSFHAGAWG